MYIPEALWVPLFLRAGSVAGDVDRTHSDLLQAFCTRLWAMNIYIIINLILK